MAGLVGALLSGFVDALFERLASEVVNSLFQGKTGIPELLNRLEIQLRSANKLLNHADEKQLTDEDVRKWLDDVREVHYEADHVIDKINYEALRRNAEEGEQSGSKKRKFINFMPKFYSAFDNTIKSEIKEILAKLDPLLKRKDELGLTEGVHQNRPQRLLAPLVDACDIYGRDADKKAIVELLLSDHNGGRKLSVIPIVGMGGIGKTTLAQLVYNDSKVQDHFALKVWVTVSEEFDVLNLTRQIIEAITSEKCDIQEQYRLQDELKKKVMRKRFLFVLDDVWNENYVLWNALRSPFDLGADGSKILVTTRNETVALKMGTVQAHTLQMIPDDDCWKLFARHAFDNRGSGFRGVERDLAE
ncbi:hypothetical protein TIFTF001_031373 [Ficus carica]|uniref:Disease resistance RPP13-like protein 1 n=1 Tax=Ficus carica TaxID=3494 RepID=A0AA88J5E8_FICCA|nr:hypothetical protein TIFTF001_031373 [Ficus carica]